jgi:hypothetical protein
MAVHAALAVQAIIYTLLSADDQLSTLGVTVYDHAPDNASYPYIVIGEDAFDDFGAHDVDGFEAVLEMHTWTQAEGKKPCKEIQDRLYQLLHDTDLGLSEHKTISLRGGMTTTMLDPDGRTYHGVNRFNLILGG